MGKGRITYYVAHYTFQADSRGRILGLSGYLYANEAELVQDAKQVGYHVIKETPDGKQVTLVPEESIAY